VVLEVDCSVSEALAEEADEVPDWPSTDRIRRWAQHAYLADNDRAASVQLVSEAEMQQLNRDWRGKDYATNVLSFPMQLDGEFDTALLTGDGALSSIPLGDIALCAVVINREAAEQHKPAEAHWAHMVVHGMLHLQGYDHIDDRDADEMEALEIKILHALGYENPYQTSL
jgi:probable rRNA maturation factor